MAEILPVPMSCNYRVLVKKMFGVPIQLGNLEKPCTCPEGTQILVLYTCVTRDLQNIPQSRFSLSRKNTPKFTPKQAVLEDMFDEV